MNFLSPCYLQGLHQRMPRFRILYLWVQERLGVGLLWYRRRSWTNYWVGNHHSWSLGRLGQIQVYRCVCVWGTQPNQGSTMTISHSIIGPTSTAIPKKSYPQTLLNPEVKDLKSWHTLMQTLQVTLSQEVHGLELLFLSIKLQSTGFPKGKMELNQAPLAANLWLWNNDVSILQTLQVTRTQEVHGLYLLFFSIKLQSTGFPKGKME